jgi:hypothetical protein
MAGSCEDGNDPSGSIKSEEIFEFLLKKGSVAARQ